MFAIGNVEKFLDDHSDTIGPRKAANILKRARQHGKPDGILAAGTLADIWRDPKLAEQFGQALSRNADHMDIGMTALQGA